MKTVTENIMTLKIFLFIIQGTYYKLFKYQNDTFYYILT